MDPACGRLVHLVVLSLAFTCGGTGCKKARVLRLTYEVDVAAAYDGEKNTDKVMDRTRATMDRRLDEMIGHRAGSVSTKGDDVIVELSALDAAALSDLKSVIARSGRLEFKLLDDRGSANVFDSRADIAFPKEEGIEVYREVAPDGLDDDGKRKSTTGFYARMACRPHKHPSESLQDCLARFRGWALALNTPADHQIGFQAVTEPVPNTEPSELRVVGWRTVYLHRHGELTQDAIIDAYVGHDQQNFNQYYVLLSFSPAGADRFEEVTGANVNRRFAIILDDIVDTAPVIKQKIGGGKATITMGAGDHDKQERDAKQLELVLRAGALPAPVHLVSEEALHPGR